jgi:hypothetical protein
MRVYFSLSARTNCNFVISYKNKIINLGLVEQLKTKRRADVGVSVRSSIVQITSKGAADRAVIPVTTNVSATHITAAH